MASFKKVGSSWKASISKNGVRKAQNFATKAEATAWAAEFEAELARGKRGDIPNKTFIDLLDRYVDEVSVKKDGHDYEFRKVEYLKAMGDALGTTKLANLDEVVVASWRNRRQQQVSDATVRREWTLYSHACTIARREWKWLHHNPFKEVERPATPTSRDQIFQKEDAEKVLLCLGCDKDVTPHNDSARVGFAFLFALETGMREGEICALTWRDIQGKLAKVTGKVRGARKTEGSKRDVPLSPEARRLLTKLPSALRDNGTEDDSVFELTTVQVDAMYRKARTKAGLDDLRFHDTRRTALTRLAKIFGPMELAKISGHTDLKTIMKTYYAPDVESFADRMG